MSPRTKKRRKDKSLHLQNPALGADFEIFLPHGWVVKKKPTAKRKRTARRPSSSRKRRR
jgi:hypothetical protein